MMKERILREYKELPYTVCGSSCLSPSFSVLLTGEGIKKLASLMKSKDHLRITFYYDRQTEFKLLESSNDS